VPTFLSWWLLSGCIAPPIGLFPTTVTTDKEPIEVGKVRLVEHKTFVPVGNNLPQPEAPLTSGQCDQLEHGGKSGECITADITCGESIVGHTRGGVKRFDTAFYTSKFCTPNTTHHDGGDERVYRLRLPEGPRRAIVTLDTPCADLDVAAILWNGDACPTNAHVVSRCEMQPKPGNTREQLELVSQHASTWLIVVEGKASEEGAFGLSVQCLDGLY
jgi:hypothetical protein